jgi:glyoxylase I family protein
MRPAGIDHVVLRVLALDQMVAFYTNVLGCSVERRQHALGLVQLRAGAQLIDLVDVEGQLGRAGGAGPGPEGRNIDHLCLLIADFDVDRIGEELRLAGVKLGAVGNRFGAGGEAVSLYLTDPEGNGLELRAG